MPSTSETSHVRNLANFEALLTACTAFGAAYQPTNPDLQLTALRQKLDQARLLSARVKEEGTRWTRTVGERRAAFAPLRSLSTRILSAVGSSGAPAEARRNVQTVHRRIQGSRAKAITPVDPAAVDPAQPVRKTRSVSRQSYDQLTDHFHELLTFLKSQEKYQPNEADLQLDTLQTRLTDLQQCCRLVREHEINLQNARRDRDQLLYAAGNGLCDQAMTIKTYVRSVFGVSSAQFRQISGLKFKSVPQ